MGSSSLSRPMLAERPTQAPAPYTESTGASRIRVSYSVASQDGLIPSGAYLSGFLFDKHSEKDVHVCPIQHKTAAWTRLTLSFLKGRIS